MRTHAISHQRPVLRRADGAVLAWLFRLTLVEGEQTAFDDIWVEVPPSDVRPLARWSRGFLDKALAAAAEPHPAPRVPNHGNEKDHRCANCMARVLHERLDARAGAYEAHDFDLGSLAP